MSEVAALSRDEWEALGHDICAIMYDAERVEDRKGRGNGLDAYRRNSTGYIDGWQFRRFDDRLENKQITNMRAALKRAAKASSHAYGGQLRTFTVFGNVDLQPGHGKKKGEDTRFEEFRAWALAQHGVTAIYRGVTWVRARLLKHPQIRPELFEDLPTAIESAKQELLAALGGENSVRRAFEELRCTSEGQLAVLVTEASHHFERGRQRGRDEDYIRAVESLRDAERLARAPGVDPRLLSLILAVLSGLLYITGQVADAITVGQEAADRARMHGDLDLQRIAFGNYALALSNHQDYDQSRRLLVEVLEMDEDAADLAEITRTLTNLLHVDVQLQNWSAAEGWAARLGRNADELEELIGPSLHTISALGNIANFHLALAHELPSSRQSEAIKRAASVHQTIITESETLGHRRTAMIARGELARCWGYLERYEESNSLFESAIALADKSLAKNAADFRHNQALMLIDAGLFDEAGSAARDARRRYRTLGDGKSVEDVHVVLQLIASRRSAQE